MASRDPTSPAARTRPGEWAVPPDDRARCTVDLDHDGPVVSHTEGDRCIKACESHAILGALA